MQAQRKVDSAPIPAPVAPQADFDWTPRLAAGERARAASPTHLLWDELAARLQEPPSVAALAAPVEAKWPMPARIATIVALSGLAWGAVFGTLYAFL